MYSDYFDEHSFWILSCFYYQITIDQRPKDSKNWSLDLSKLSNVNVLN